ncbi:hypothetical protein [Kribbella sp. NPDC055071]
MTDTELKHRLSAEVDDIEAPADLLDRARAGGARRLRRRRFLALSAAAAAVVVVGGVAVSGQAVLDHLSDSPVAGTPAPGDPYAFLMNGTTGGDLAGDEIYLNEVLKTWRTSHRKSINFSRGIFDHMQGNAKVAWAGNTPGGRAAIVVEYADLRNHTDVQLDHEGVATLIGFVGDGKNGKPTVIGDGYPVPGSSLAAGFVVEKAGTKALVAIDMNGRKIGWSTGRTYEADGSVQRKFSALSFRDHVSVVTLAADQQLGALRLTRLPSPAGFSDLSIVNGDVNAAPPSTEGRRLWEDVPDFQLWPMTNGANSLKAKAAARFDQAVSAVSDQNAFSVSNSMWTGYGVTANGTAVYIGEQQLELDPTHIYAVLQPKTGKAKIVSGGVPDGDDILPVSIKLPDNQGWAIARYQAKLSYRIDGGAWSQERSDALLVPAGTTVEVRVVRNGDMADIVTLH